METHCSPRAMARRDRVVVLLESAGFRRAEFGTPRVEFGNTHYECSVPGFLAIPGEEFVSLSYSIPRQDLDDPAVREVAQQELRGYYEVLVANPDVCYCVQSNMWGGLDVYVRD